MMMIEVCKIKREEAKNAYARSLPPQRGNALGWRRASRRLRRASARSWRAALHRASGMASTTTGRVLASMRPYTVVAAISRVGGRSYGLALSDPYLSHAAPLSTVRGPGDAVL